ncbi:MAG: hypothetical protein DYH20_16185 [Gammaproteobacteria bacterium PRO9]|nr:hypothetical protein [Gammaproteobacteria bacterium PRO9]
MPSRKTTKAAEAAAAKLPTIPKELIDQFVTGPMSPEAVQAASAEGKLCRSYFGYFQRQPDGVRLGVARRAAGGTVHRQLRRGRHVSGHHGDLSLR